MDYEIGSVVGDYEIVKVLGAGGMGEVYQVRNTISGRIDAMKVLLPGTESNPELVDRFMREIKVSAGLEHPNIACLRTAMRSGKNLVMIMEFVEGSTLEQLLERQPIPVRQGIDYIRQVLCALAYAHERGVVHRDIKPANMMLTPAGVVKLMDFGIARISDDRSLTRVGQTVGSLSYMSPEQIQNTQTPDARSDLYSVGISLYEMVTGSLPFHGDSDFSLMTAHLQHAPVPPIQVDPSLPSALNDIILMSISKDPLQRFQTADAFRNALQNVLESLPESAKPIPATARARTVLEGPSRPPALAPTVVAGAAAPPPPPLRAPQPAPMLIPAAAMAPPPQSSSRRGLYMVLGSVATVLVLALAAFQLPKMFKTSAAVGSAFPSGQTPSGSSQIQSGSSGQAGTVVLQDSSSTGSALPGASTGGSAPAGRSAPAQGGGAKQGQQAQQQAQQGQQTQQGQQAQPPPQPPPSQQQQQQQQQQQPAGPDPAVVAELKELRHRQALMAARIGGIKGSLRQLQQQQAASGLGISPELVSTEHRMEMLMDKAEGEIREGDPVAAKRSLDAAERDLEKLEERFGR